MAHLFSDEPLSSPRLSRRIKAARGGSSGAGVAERVGAPKAWVVAFERNSV
jgi:hypothetical protein